MRGTAQGASGLKTVWAMWSRRKLLATMVFVGGFAGALTVAASLPSIYRAAATVLVERQEVAESLVRPSVTGELDTRLQTISQEILSRARLETLVERFDLYPDMRRRLPIDAAIERARRDIHIELREVKGVESAAAGHGPTIGFTVTFRGRTPRTTAEVANALASSYVQENLKIRDRMATDTAQFLKVQLDETQRRLDEAERRISEYKRRHLGELPEQLSVNLAMLERLNSQLALNSDKQMRAIERRDQLARQLAFGGSLNAAEAEADPELRLARLRFELARMQRLYSPKYPDVVRLKAEIAAAEEQLSRTHGRGAAAAARERSSGDLDGELNGLKAEEQRLRRAIADYQRRVDVAPELEQDFQGMARDYRNTKETYDSMLKRYQDAQVAEDMERRRSREEFRLLDAALPPREPWAPNRMRVLLLGLLLSVAATAVAVALAEQFDTSFHTVDDLRAFTKIPVLATIPCLVSATDADRRRRRRQLAAVSIPLALALVVLASYRFAHGNEQLVWMLSHGAS
jgi:protein tyrosine kinase modulator